MMPPRPVVAVETDVDVTRVVAVDAPRVLDIPVKLSVIPVVALAIGKVCKVFGVAGPGSTTTVTP